MWLRSGSGVRAAIVSEATRPNPGPTIPPSSQEKSSERVRCARTYNVCSQSKNGSAKAATCCASEREDKRLGSSR